MCSDNFQQKIFLVENVTPKIFHANYLKVKIMPTKMKQITVLRYSERQLTESNEKRHVLYMHVCKYLHHIYLIGCVLDKDPIGLKRRTLLTHLAFDININLILYTAKISMGAKKRSNPN